MSRKKLNQFLTNSLDSSDVRRAFSRVSDETILRPVRPCRCVVIDIPETTQAKDFADITPGTVTAFVAHEGESLLSKVAKGIKANNSKDFDLATNQIKQLELKFFRKLMAAEICPESQPLPIPSFAEINYAGKTLISHAAVNEELPVDVHAFPYNGGYLDKSKFSMLEYYRDDYDTPLTCVLVVRQPQLSEIEREALRLVPSELSMNNIAPSALRFWTPVLVWVAEAAAAAAVGWVVGKVLDWLFGFAALSSIPDEVVESEDFQRRIKSLPNEVTAAELLQLRTDILLRKWPK